MSTQPRYRVIYSTTERPYYMIYSQTDRITEAIEQHRWLSAGPNVTFAYIYDGETKTRFNVTGRDPNE